MGVTAGLSLPSLPSDRFHLHHDEPRFHYV